MLINQLMSTVRTLMKTFKNKNKTNKNIDNIAYDIFKAMIQQISKYRKPPKKIILKFSAIPE